MGPRGKKRRSPFGRVGPTPLEKATGVAGWRSASVEFSFLAIQRLSRGGQGCCKADWPTSPHLLHGLDSENRWGRGPNFELSCERRRLGRRRALLGSCPLGVRTGLAPFDCFSGC